MKSEILKIAGCKTQKEFYDKYPSEEAFMKAHGKEFKKAQIGAQINKSIPKEITPIDFQGNMDKLERQYYGATKKKERLLNY